MGPYQIAKQLTEEKIEKPSYYQATRQRGNYKTMCDFETPYNWTGGSVVRILERPEYMGDTVNFRSHKESYKDKKAVKNSSEDILIFRDTHEAVVDRRTWYMVQELRKTVRKVDVGGEGSLLTGKLYCADCGGKMHYRRGTTRAGRDWRGIPNGEVQHTSAGFNCSTYNSSRKQCRQICCSHSIKEDTVKQLILETIQYALKSVRMDEAAFIKSMRSASEVRDKGEVKKLKAGLSKKERRFADLDLLIKKVYEDNAMGKLPDRRYEMLSSDYEKEQQKIEVSMREIQEKLMQFEQDTDRTEEFLSLVHKYTDIQELTPAIVNEFVDKVMVHKIEKTDGDRVQEIEIFLNYIGKVELPAQELSEEEMADEEKKRKRRQYRREYQKAYREKHRLEIPRVIEGAREADKQKQIAEAERATDVLLSMDSTEQVAVMVSGENKVIAESRLPTKEEVKAKYGR
jgi:site-specific DNA recombinase